MSDEAQIGFRKGQSCTDFTLIFYNKLSDPGYVTDWAYLDLTNTCF